MEENQHKKWALLVYGLLLLYFIAYALISYRVTRITDQNMGELGQFFVYERVGELRYNLVPFSNYVRLALGGHPGAAVGLLLVQVAELVPLGIALPLLQKRLHRYYKTVLLGWGFLMAIQYVPTMLSKVGLVNVDDMIITFVSISIGYWIWNRFVPKDEEFVNAVAIDF